MEFSVLLLWLHQPLLGPILGLWFCLYEPHSIISHSLVPNSLTPPDLMDGVMTHYKQRADRWIKPDGGTHANQAPGRVVLGLFSPKSSKTNPANTLASQQGVRVS